jgi:NTP pyrophosphatase (non-canonical NTP hydrolase)
LRQLADELADVIICVDLIALYEGIDIWESVKRKFNETSRNNNLDTTL